MAALTKQPQHDAPVDRPPQLRRKTTNPKLNSYANAASKTTSSYEKNVFSYDGGRTPSCKSPQTVPKRPSTSYAVRPQIPI